MLGDSHQQEQKQDVKQETIVGQNSQLEVSCDYYTNAHIEYIEGQLNQARSRGGFHPGMIAMSHEMKKAQQVSILQHHGKVTKVFCSLNEGNICKSSKHSNKKCYLLEQ